MINKKTKKNKGFTLVETLFAIFILVVATTGPMAAAQSSLKASFLARDQVVAFYLAQDVIEAIKNVRDDNYVFNLKNSNLPPRNWLGDPSDSNKLAGSNCFNSGLECGVDTSEIYTTYEIGLTNNCGDCDLNLDAGNRTFTHGVGNDTIYSREVYFDDNFNDENELKIIVKVTWDTPSLLSGTRSIIVQENIYNWLDY